MKTMHILAALGATVALAPVSAELTGVGYRSARIQDGAVCVAEGGATTRCFARDGKHKSLPLWSKDGNRLAVLVAPADGARLATLALFDRHGQQLGSVAIKPVAPGEVASGMRAVEYLEWIDQHRMLVGGSINPSSGEYLLIDVGTGAVVKEWIDDGGGVAISPNGKHIATLTGAPHFSSAEARAPTLVIDDEEVVGLAPLQAMPEGRPMWSPDSAALALRLRRHDGGVGVLLWNAAKRVHSYAAVPGMRDGERLFLSWRKRDLVATREATPARPGQAATPRRTLVLSNASAAPNAGAFVPVREPAPTVSRGSAQQLASEARRQASGEVDIWCARCGLEAMPRATGPLNETDH